MSSPEREFDVVVVGGSAAGLAAALQMVRQRRSVAVIDSGEPRNAPASAQHNYLGYDGTPPDALLATGREEVRSYGGEVLAGRVVEVTRQDDRFRVSLEDGHTVVGRRVLAATGLADVLPDVEGLERHWGHDVLHCVFCHGFEIRDRRVVMVVTHPLALHPAPLFRRLATELTIVCHEGLDPGDEQLDSLRAAGVKIAAGPARRVLTADDGRLSGLELADGSRIEADAVVVAPRSRARAEPFAAVGLVPSQHPSGLGDFVETSPTGQTSVEGIYAAGNIADPRAQLLTAAAAGSTAGAAICFDLAAEDTAGVLRPPAQESYWEKRYSGERTWSGNPNGALVAEIDGMTPGRALEIGAGEGADALWLAQQGWQVTATDISTAGLAQVAALAAEHGADIECRRFDASGAGPVEPEAFDLVSAHYVPIPRSPDNRATANLLGSVAPGGTLLFVAHDMAAMRDHADAEGHSFLWDPDAYLRPEDLVAALTAWPDWEIETHETRSRPHGHASVDVPDVVLRARRR